MKKIFIDESGNHGFNFSKQGDSKFFILTAIVVDENEKVELERKLEELSKKINNGKEFKSTKIKNDKNYKLLFKDLNDFNFDIFTFIVDKELIFSDSGLRKDKKTFYKFFSKKFYKILELHYSNISISYDEIGRESFRSEFEKYLMKNFKYENKLFNLPSENEFRFNFEDSNSSRLIQLADLVSGRVKKSFENSNSEFLEYFQEKLMIRKFPISKKDAKLLQLNIGKGVDLKILEASIQGLITFTEEKQKNEYYEKHIQLLEYLYTKLHLNPKEFILKSKLKKTLSTSEDELSRMISELREIPILISSSRQGGYKIASSITDITEFFENFHKTTKGMMIKMNKFNDILKTNVGIDLLEKEEFEYIKLGGKE